MWTRLPSSRGTSLAASEPMHPPPFFYERGHQRFGVVTTMEPPGLGLRPATALASFALAVREKRLAST